MSRDEQQPLEFEGVPTTNWYIGPLPLPRFVRFIARLFGGREAPEQLRSARASPAPRIDTSTWPEGVPRVPGVRLRVPSGVRQRSLADPDPGRRGEVLVGLWEDGQRSLAIWVGGKPEFPVGVYSLDQWPVLEERTEAMEWVSGRELAITSFRVSVRGRESHYEVGAYCHMGAGRWLRAAARARSRGNQEEFLAALRSLDFM